MICNVISSFKIWLEEVKDFSWFWILFTTGSSDNSPASFESDPLKVFSFNNVLALLTAVIKVCKLVFAEVVSTEENDENITHVEVLDQNNSDLPSY